MEVIVTRHPGNKDGPDLIEALLATVPVALSRGRREMDENAHAKADVTLTTLYRSGVRLGQLIEVNDALQGETWYGKITGINHRIGPSDAGLVVLTTLTIRRPTDFYD